MTTYIRHGFQEVALLGEDSTGGCAPNIKVDDFAILRRSQDTTA
jgi:hypothetical protein